MSDSIVVVIVSSIATIITVIISTFATMNKMTNELDKANALQSKEIDHIKEEILEMKKDIKSHNNYARMFAETMPVVQERISAMSQRVENVERKVN